MIVDPPLPSFLRPLGRLAGGGGLRLATWGESAVVCESVVADSSRRLRMLEAANARRRCRPEGVLPLLAAHPVDGGLVRIWPYVPGPSLADARAEGALTDETIATLAVRLLPAAVAAAAAGWGLGPRPADRVLLAGRVPLLAAACAPSELPAHVGLARELADCLRAPGCPQSHSSSRSDAARALHASLREIADVGEVGVPDAVDEALELVVRAGSAQIMRASASPRRSSVNGNPAA